MYQMGLAGGSSKKYTVPANQATVTLPVPLADSVYIEGSILLLPGSNIIFEALPNGYAGPNLTFGRSTGFGGISHTPVADKWELSENFSSSLQGLENHILIELELWLFPLANQGSVAVRPRFRSSLAGHYRNSGGDERFAHYWTAGNYESTDNVESLDIAVGAPNIVADSWFKVSAR